MYKPVKFIATIRDDERNVNYFYYDKEKTIIPLEYVENGEVPTIFNTLVRTVIALSAKIVEIKIFKHLEDTFYTYLSIRQADRLFDIYLDFEDAVKLISEFEIKVKLEKQIIDTEGFIVTKDLIEKAINGNTYLYFPDVPPK